MPEPLPAATNTLSSWCRWWQRFPDRDRLLRAGPNDLLRMIMFLYHLPSFAPAPGESWAGVWAFGHRAIDGLTLAAAEPHRRLDALKIKGLWPVVREHLREAVEVSRRRRAEALEATARGEKQGGHNIQFLEQLPSFLPAGRPSEGESTAFREGLQELERLSYCLEAERAGKLPQKPKKPEAQPLTTDVAANRLQAWDDDAAEYLPLSAARKLIDDRLSLQTLGRLCKPDGEIRYMRKGQRCKVHVADFRRYMRGRQSDPEWAEAYMNWLHATKVGKKRMFWKCENAACGHEYPEDANATVQCPKCKNESKLLTKAPPKPHR